MQQKDIQKINRNRKTIGLSPLNTKDTKWSEYSEEYIKNLTPNTNLGLNFLTGAIQFGPQETKLLNAAKDQKEANVMLEYIVGSGKNSLKEAIQHNSRQEYDSNQHLNGNDYYEVNKDYVNFMFENNIESVR